MNKDKQALCSGCGKVHYMSKRPQPGGEQNTLHLTLMGWWASDLLRRQNNRKWAQSAAQNPHAQYEYPKMSGSATACLSRCGTRDLHCKSARPWWG